MADLARDLEKRIADLERSNDHLRGALIAAAREMKKRNFGKRGPLLLASLRQTLREARRVRYGLSGPKLCGQRVGAFVAFLNIWIVAMMDFSFRRVKNNFLASICTKIEGSR